MSDTNTSLIERIRKLMTRTTDRGVTEAEAQAASDKVKELLDAHNLDMSQIEMDSGTGSGEKRVKTQHLRSAMYDYQRSLMKVLAENNFCMYFVEKRHKDEGNKTRYVNCHVLLGRKMNMEVTMMTYDYLVETIDRLLPYQGMDKRGKNALLWLGGCTDRLVLRLTAIRKVRAEEDARRQQEEETRAKHPGAAAPGRGLVLADVYSSEDDYNHDALNGWAPGTTAENKRVAKVKVENDWAAREEKVRGLKEEYPDLDYRIINYMSWGWTLIDATHEVETRKAWQEKFDAEQAKRAARPETEAARRKREEKDRRMTADSEYRQAKQGQRFFSAAYQAGAAVGSDIGLDTQVGQDTRIGIKGT